MFSLTEIVMLFVFGAAGGLLAGTLGIGGGIIYVIVLNHFLERYNLPGAELVRFVLSNSIAATFFAGITGTIKQRSKGNFYPKEILTTGFAGVISALLVTFTIVQWNWYNREIFSLFFMGILLVMIINMFLSRKKNNVETDIAKPHEAFFGKPIYAFILAGIVTGAVSSLTGLGGGVVLIPLLGLAGVQMRQAASISLGIIPMQALAMGIYYAFADGGNATELPYSMGYIIFPVLLPMLAGVVLVTPIGVRISHKLTQKQVKIIFAIVTLLIFAKTLYTYLYGGR